MIEDFFIIGRASERERKWGNANLAINSS